MQIIIIPFQKMIERQLQIAVILLIILFFKIYRCSDVRAPAADPLQAADVGAARRRPGLLRPLLHLPGGRLQSS